MMLRKLSEPSETMSKRSWSFGWDQEIGEDSYLWQQRKRHYEWRKGQDPGNRWETAGAIKEMAVVEFGWITGYVKGTIGGWDGPEVRQNQTTSDFILHILVNH